LADQKLKEKANELRAWYNQQSRILKDQEEKLAASKKEVATLNGKLTERAAQLDARDKDLAAREGALAATLRAKDEEIETLLKQWTRELEDGHKKSIETQALENAAKLKEASDRAATAASTKTELESQVTKLKEDLAGSGKEIEALKGEALKAARTLGDLQTQLSSKSQDLEAAAKTIRDLKSQLAILVSDLESAKERESESAYGT
jgi:chromosome segregation ATPase